ncbi:MAG: ParB/RepB/Spo0J family partition protein [Armatimonadetes bacterium]|nr:ParB/RepB/Spo0J family partition protein [Armatimonadota bacterium]
MPDSQPPSTSKPFAQSVPADLSPGSGRRRGLGRGLGALIPGAEVPVEDRTTEIPISRLTANPMQPRSSMDPQEFAGLVDSVRKHGVLQPIVVRPAGDGFEVVAGERRWRAAEAAGLNAVLAVVRTLTDQEALELALVENLQREDLNPIERARAYRRLIDEFGLTQEQVADRVGKSQPSVANGLRLLNLPPQIQAALEAGRITEGHARAILSLGSESGMLKLWERVERRGLSVRETESLVRGSISREILPRPRSQDPQLRSLEHDLSRRFGTKVTIHGVRGRGTLAFQYYSEEDLQRLLDLFLR